MQKIRVEQREGDIWKGTKLQVYWSGKGNLYVKYHRDGNLVEERLIFKTQKVGEPVLSKVDGKWIQVGRIDVAGNIFLGGEDELSYAEYQRTPEALEVSRKFLEEWRNRGKS